MKSNIYEERARKWVNNMLFGGQHEEIIKKIAELQQKADTAYSEGYEQGYSDRLGEYSAF